MARNLLDLFGKERKITNVREASKAPMLDVAGERHKLKRQYARTGPRDADNLKKRRAMKLMRKVMEGQARAPVPQQLPFTPLPGSSPREAQRQRIAARVPRPRMNIPPAPTPEQAAAMYQLHEGAPAGPLDTARFFGGTKDEDKAIATAGSRHRLSRMPVLDERKDEIHRNTQDRFRGMTPQMIADLEQDVRTKQLAGDLTEGTMPYKVSEAESEAELAKETAAAEKIANEGLKEGLGAPPEHTLDRIPALEEVRKTALAKGDRETARWADSEIDRLMGQTGAPHAPSNDPNDIGAPEPPRTQIPDSNVIGPETITRYAGSAEGAMSIAGLGEILTDEGYNVLEEIGRDWGSPNKENLVRLADLTEKVQFAMSLLRDNDVAMKSLASHIRKELTRTNAAKWRDQTKSDSTKWKRAMFGAPVSANKWKQAIELMDQLYAMTDIAGR